MRYFYQAEKIAVKCDEMLNDAVGEMVAAIAEHRGEPALVKAAVCGEDGVVPSCGAAGGGRKKKKKKKKEEEEEEEKKAKKKKKKKKKKKAKEL